MNMKSYAGFLAMTMMMGGMGMTTSGRDRYRSSNTKYKEPKPFHFETIIPKGHKVESIGFRFEFPNAIYTINVLVSFGTRKAGEKKIALLHNELHQYLVQTPDKKLREFGQFKIEEVIKPEVKKVIVENVSAEKGEFHGNCNRTACQKPGAVYYNHSTEKYYCSECANKINKMNPESFQIFGHELCTFATEPVI